MSDLEDPPGKYRAPALEKGLDVLELLATRGVPMGMVQIAAALNRSVSELFRMIQVLERRGYLTTAPEGEGLVLTNKLFSVGMAQAPTKSVVEAALPVMRRLSNLVGQSCHLAVASAGDMVVVATVEAPGNQGFSVRVGYHRPMVETTSGLVLYAFEAEAARAEWRGRYSGETSKAVWEDFEHRAERARGEGYVRQPSLVTKLVIDLSAPVMAQNGVAAALTVPYIDNPAAIDQSQTIGAIKTSAFEITESIGGQFQ